ncbi:hypothetical protein [Sphingomonas abaci]|uniref:Uncharacterized protein n=1 Tax=Sphingomonas abaci TaxID=237611 RepID=A0A7W7AHP6_9SPHN|nr:hypothetical protein [Sphingomonas abaci]MBB4617229.1 hypothetical protein [Sphingomonas abaci]
MGPDLTLDDDVWPLSFHGNRSVPGTPLPGGAHHPISVARATGDTQVTA